MKNCENCKNRLDLEIWDYAHPAEGVKRIRLPGFVCTMFSPEGFGAYMLGVDGKKGICECYEEKEK